MKLEEWKAAVQAGKEWSEELRTTAAKDGQGRLITAFIYIYWLQAEPNTSLYSDDNGVSSDRWQQLESKA